MILWCATSSRMEFSRRRAQFIVFCAEFPHSWKRFRAISKRVCLHKKKQEKPFTGKNPHVDLENYCVARNAKEKHTFTHTHGAGKKTFVCLHNEQQFLIVKQDKKRKIITREANLKIYWFNQKIIFSSFESIGRKTLRWRKDNSNPLVAKFCFVPNPSFCFHGSSPEIRSFRCPIRN